MATGKTATEPRRSARGRRAGAEGQAAPPAAAPKTASKSASRGPSTRAAASQKPVASQKPAASSKRAPAALRVPPSAAPCRDLALLQSLAPEAAREHVERYLHEVMSGGEADAFEASSYRWELHLVEIEQLRLVRGVDLDRKKVRRYLTVLKREGAFPALIGLGGDGRDVTRDVLLCDGYHRAAAMRDYGVHFVWVWLATGVWQQPVSSLPHTATSAAHGAARD